MAGAAATFGAFGKMPALGDFFRVNLPVGFAGPWDRWVQDGLLGARAALGDRWQGCYFSAPIWRFTLSAGLAGPVAVQGVLMPSVDRVGRQFPLTLVEAVLAPDVQAAHQAAAGRFAALEDVALAALDDGMTGIALLALLQDIPSLAAPATAAGPRGSVWTAQLADRMLAHAQPSLPTPARMADFYDPGAAHWAPAPAEGATP